MNPQQILSPVLEHGLAGVVAALLCMQWWLMRRLLAILVETNAVISGNTSAIRSLETRTAEYVRTLDDVRDRLLSRPCIAAD